jgi:hypothetical protein
MARGMDTNSKKAKALIKIKELLEEIYPNLNIEIQGTLNTTDDELDIDCLTISLLAKDEYGKEIDGDFQAVLPAYDEWGDPYLNINIEETT